MLENLGGLKLRFKLTPYPDSLCRVLSHRGPAVRRRGRLVLWHTHIGVNLTVSCALWSRLRVLKLEAG